MLKKILNDEKQVYRHLRTLWKTTDIYALTRYTQVSCSPLHRKYRIAIGKGEKDKKGVGNH